MLWPLGMLCPGKTDPMEKSVTHVLLQAEKEGSLLCGADSLAFLTTNGKAEVRSLRQRGRHSGVLRSVSQKGRH